MAEAKHKQHGRAPAVVPDRKPPQDRQAQGRETLTANQPATSVAESFRRAIDDARRCRSNLERALADNNTAVAALVAADLKCALAAAASAAEIAAGPEAVQMRAQLRELEASSTALLERAPAVAQSRPDGDRVVAALGSTPTTGVKRPALKDHPAYSPMTTANMTADVATIVELLQGQWLSESDQQTIVGRVERYVHIDASLQDLYPNATHYTDRFLGMLRARAYHRSSVATLLQTQHAIVFDDLWHRLAGGAGTRFRRIVWSSGNPTGGGERPETAMDAVVAPVFWRATALLSFGIVEPSLFDEMMAAKGNTERLGLVFRRIGGAAFDVLTFGGGRPAYNATLAYIKQHPDCTLAEASSAGLLAAANAILPLPELTLIAKALGVIAPDAGELKPDTARAVQAFFEGALKVIIIGAIVHAKVQSGRAASAEQVREQLTPNRPRPRAPAPPKPMPPWRAEILRRVRQLSGNPDVVFWEQVPMGAHYEIVKAGPIAAETLGVDVNAVIGYTIKSGKVTGGAIGDLMNVETTAPPFPDPFAGKPSAGPLGTPGTSRPPPPSRPPAPQPRPTRPAPQQRANSSPPARPAGRSRGLIADLKQRSVPSDRQGNPNPDFDPNTPKHIADHFKNEQRRTGSDSPGKWKNPPGYQAQHPNGRLFARHGEPPGTRLHWGTAADNQLQKIREMGQTPRQPPKPLP